jgi:hypothetical membrane protein
MKYELQVFFILMAVGLIARKMSPAGWFTIMLFVFSWIMMSWKRNVFTAIGALFGALCVAAWLVFTCVDRARDPMVHEDTENPS